MSTRLDEEEMVRAEEDVEAMMSLNLNKALIFLLLFFLFFFLLSFVRDSKTTRMGIEFR